MRWLIELSVLTSTETNLSSPPIAAPPSFYRLYLQCPFFHSRKRLELFDLCLLHYCCSTTDGAYPSAFLGVGFAFPCPVSVCVMRIIARYSISILNEFVPELSGRSDPFQPGSLLCGLWWRQEQPSRNVQRFSAHQFRCPSAYCTCMYVAAVALPL